MSDNAKLAYLLGAIYGDGCFIKDGKLAFGSTDKEFTEQISNIVRELFNIELNIRKIKLSLKNPNWKDFFEFRSRRLFKLLSEFNPKSTTTIVPDFIENGNLEVKSAFLRGYFDAEGNVNLSTIKRKDRGISETSRRVRCYSNDIPMLKKISNLLNQLGIKSSIFRGKKENFYVCIWNYQSIKKFYEMVGFVIKRKQAALISILNSYKEIQTRWDTDTYLTVMKLRDKEMIGSKRIKDRLSLKGINIPQPTIEAWIYKRYKISEKQGGINNGK